MRGERRVFAPHNNRTLYVEPGTLNSTVMPASDSPAPRRLRFTLRGLLVAIAAIALVVTWLNTFRVAEQNRLLILENRRLRDEVGELSVEDESQLHAIRIPSSNELEWVWRIWIPPGRSYRLRTIGGPIPKAGFPQGGGTLTLSQPGEYSVRYRIERDPISNQWRGTLYTRTGSVGSDTHPWVEWQVRTGTDDSVGTATEVFSPGQRVELIRHRVSQATSSDKIEDPAAGFLIWLEPN